MISIEGSSIGGLGSNWSVNNVEVLDEDLISWDGSIISINLRVVTSNPQCNKVKWEHSLESLEGLSGCVVLGNIVWLGDG